jgi:hypothetical protein
MKNHQASWLKLAAAARANHDGHDESAPYGFAGRVVSQAFAAPAAGAPGLLEKFALRGLIAACTFSLAAMAFGYIAPAGEHDDEVASTDTVGEILDLS